MKIPFWTGRPGKGGEIAESIANTPQKGVAKRGKRRSAKGSRLARTGTRKKSPQRRSTGGKLSFELGWRQKPMDYAEIASLARSKPKKFYRVFDAIGSGNADEFRWHKHWMQRVAGSQIDQVNIKQWTYGIAATVPAVILAWLLLAGIDRGQTNGWLIFLMGLATGTLSLGVPIHLLYGYLGGFWYTHIKVWAIKYEEDGQIESVFRVWLPRLALLEKYEAIRGNSGRAGILDRESYAKLIVPDDIDAHNLRDVETIYDFDPDINEMSGNTEAARYATIQYCLSSAKVCRSFKYTEKGNENNWVDKYGLYALSILFSILAVVVIVAG